VLRGTPLRARLLAAAALIAAPTVLLATPGTADAATTTNPADAGAGWLGRQLDDDTHLMIGTFDSGSGPVSFEDYGLTADVVLALDAAKVGRAAARRATRALKHRVLAYTGGSASEQYAGSYAKLLVVAVAQGVDPTSFGHGPRKDLVAGLRALECGTPTRTDCAATDDGRFANRSAFEGPDFSGTIGQSLALIGLERATKRGPSRSSVQFLLGQQCAAGGFPENFDATPCVPSTDATGFAAQALATVGGPAAKAAAADAGRWLTRHQHPNGSFSGNGVRNANSTALAAQALTAVGRDRAAARAGAYLRSLQVGCGRKPAVRGEVRYDRKGSGEAARATSQAVPALALATLADISNDGSSRGLPRLAC
jgi:hypothetical protein